MFIEFITAKSSKYSSWILRDLTNNNDIGIFIFQVYLFFLIKFESIILDYRRRAYLR
jgi:hypothetical protein